MAELLSAVEGATQLCKLGSHRAARTLLEAGVDQGWEARAVYWVAKAKIEEVGHTLSRLAYHRHGRDVGVFVGNSKDRGACMERDLP